MWLIRFTYDYHGYEETTEIRLVHAITFSVACQRLMKRFINARDFQNLTI